MKLRTIPVITLTPEDRDIIDRIGEFIGRLQHNICDKVENCSECPIKGTCNQFLMGQPINISYFFNEIEENAMDEED